jgi:hypothetical protein
VPQHSHILCVISRSDITTVFYVRRIIKWQRIINLKNVEQNVGSLMLGIDEGNKLRVVDVLAEIRTKYLPNASQNRCLLSTLSLSDTITIGPVPLFV